MKHKASFFLAVIILALVAVSIGYLVHTPGLKKPSAAVKDVKVDKAEVLIDGFRFAKSESNNDNWELLAKTAEMKNDTGLAMLNDLEATFTGRNGTVLKLRADQGTFDSKSKSVTLGRQEKDITITSNNGYKMTVKDLNWDDGKKEMRTDNMVRLEGKNIKIEGKGLITKTDLQEVRITNGVKTVFSPGR